MSEGVQPQPQSFTLSHPPSPFLYLLFYLFSYSFPSYPSLSLACSLSLTHSEIHTEMLKLAASISAPALAPKASEQEAEDASKTSLSNARAHVCTQTHTHTVSSFILIHSFFLTCTTERWHKCAVVHTQTCLHAQTHTNGETQTNKAGHSGPPPSGCLSQPICQLSVPSYVNRSLCVTSICLNEKDNLDWLTIPTLYHLIMVIHCVKNTHSTCTYCRIHVCSACAHTHAYIYKC